MNNIAIIAARSGSKGLKDKNIKEFVGKPLIAYTIEAAKQSKIFDTIIVSTDSDRYAQIAIEFGAEIPFLRSKRTSTDSASSWDVVKEVLSFYNNQGESFDTFCLLQPTSPLRTFEDIIEAYNIFEEKHAVAVISMCQNEHPVEWCGLLKENKSLDGFIQRNSAGQRQKMKLYYRPNGAIYIFNVEEFYKDNFFYRNNCYAYIMPNDRSIDIDTELDFEFAEMIYKKLNGI